MKNSCLVEFGGVGLCGLDLWILVVVIDFGGLNEWYAVNRVESVCYVRFVALRTWLGSLQN